MKQKILIATGAVLAVAIVFFCGIWLGNKPVAYGNAIAGTSGVFFSVATSSVQTIGTSNTLLIGTSTGRTWLRISNNSANVVLCRFDNGLPAALPSTGFLLAASSTYEMNQLSEPVYTGAVNCISDTGASATVYVEANQ